MLVGVALDVIKRVGLDSRWLSRRFCSALSCNMRRVEVIDPVALEAQEEAFEADGAAAATKPCGEDNLPLARTVTTPELAARVPKLFKKPNDSF